MEKGNISWDSIPEFLSILSGKMDIINAKLDKLHDNHKIHETDKKMDITELSKYIPGNPAIQTIYQWCSKGLIPYHKPAKRLYFFQSEIDSWLMSSHRKSADELMDEAKQYISNKKKGCRK